MDEEWSPIFTAIVERKYRIVIPSPVRRVMNIGEGDVVEVQVRRVKRQWKVLRE